MNIFGIGTLELAVIFLVAIIALGPGKTMETARTIGRIVREARRTFTEVMDAASVGDEDGERRRGNATGSSAGGTVKPPAVPLESPAHLAGQAGDDDDRGDGGASAGAGGSGDEGGGTRRSGQDSG